MAEKAEKAQLDIKSKLEAGLQKSKFLPSATATSNQSKQPSQTKTTDEVKSTEESKEETGTDKKAKKPVKPGQPRKVNLYLVDPERFVIEWRAPKKLGNPFPLHYDIVINEHTFTKAVSQSDTKAKTSGVFRILVHNCESDELYKVAIDTYNDAVKGRSSSFYSIKTILKPSVVMDLNMSNGVITWKPPLYQSFGDLSYELIDADDVEEKTILSTKECQINIDEYYQQQAPDTNLDELTWRVRIKDTKGNHCSFSPIIGYNIGDITCSKFTAAQVFDGVIDGLKTIKYPKWEPPPKPDLLKQVQQLECIDKGSYLLVPSDIDLNETTKENVLTCICFSDTHTKHDAYRFDNLPPADIVLHAGDFTFDGNKGEVRSFERWGRFIASLHVDETKNAALYDAYYSQEKKKTNDEDEDDGQEEKKNANEETVQLALEDRKYKHLVCIAGNHDMTFHVDWYNKPGSNAQRYHRMKKMAWNAQEVKDIIAKSAYWQYLEDSAVTLYGVKIYGSPWQPFFYNWAFQLSRGEELDEKWKMIPKDTDILVTHGPPFCHGDKVNIDRVRQTGDDREYTGDEDLLKRVTEIGSIQYHVFGHVHAGFGASKQDNVQTTFVNAASLNETYYPTHKPIVFHIRKKL